MRLVIIANPAAGRGRAFRKLKRHVREWPYRDWTFEILLTRCPEHAGAIARELLASPPDLLAVCGGDGTINEVVSSVPDPPFPVAVIPAGMANVLARELGLPLDPVKALRTALSGVARRMDRGILRSRTIRGFLLMAGVGFDAFVASRVSPALKKRIGKAAFYLSTMQCLASYSFPEFRVLMDGESLGATSCVIANARGYGGGLVLTPNADMADGIFDILVIQGRSKLGYLRFLWSAWLGRPFQFPWIEHRRSQWVKVEGAQGTWVQVDGELAGTLPVEISLIPAAFPLIVPGPVPP